MLRAPYDGFGADDARDPDGRMGLLIGQRPWVDEAVVEMLPFPAERTGTRPRRDHDIVRLVEILAVVGRVGIVEELFAARAPDPSGDKAAMGDKIDFRQLLSHPERILQ